MSVEDAERLNAVLKGTVLKPATEDVICSRNQIAFPNSGGMLTHPDGHYGDTPILCDVDIFLTGDRAIAVATMPGPGRNILGRVTVGLGATAQVKPAINALLSGRAPFNDYFDPVFYSYGTSRN